MKRFNRQEAINLMNEARKKDKDEEFQKTLDEIYSKITNSARKGYGSITYGPLECSLATQAASFLEGKGFITIAWRALGGGCEFEIIWEEGY